MNAVEYIKRDHASVERKFAAYQLAQTTEERRDMSEDICNALEAHAQMEEQFFYPAIQNEGSAKGRDLIAHALEEHSEMRMLITRIGQESEEMEAGMEKLIAMVEGHVEEEEGELLPEAVSSLEPSRLQELGESMAALSPSR